MKRIALFALLLLSCLLTSCHVNKDYDLNQEIDARMVLARGITFPIGDVGGGIKYGMVTQKGATPDADPIETDQVDLGSFDVSRFGLMQPGGVGLMGMYRVDNFFHWGELRSSLNYRPWQWLSLSVSGAYNSYGWEYGASLAVQTKLLHFFIGSDALLQEITPQFVPIGKLNHNLTLGLGIQL